MKRLSFYSKIIFAFIGLAVIPLIIHVLYLSAGLKDSDSYLRGKAAEVLDGQTAFMLRQTAENTADKIALFLNTVKSDTETLTLAEPTYQTFYQFYNMHKGTVWEVKNGIETRSSQPLYNEIVFVSPEGKELVRLRDGQSATLRDVCRADFFIKTIGADEIYVSRLQGRHVREQDKELYSGEFIFSVKVMRNREIKGVLAVYLSQKHLDEMIKHIDPAGGLVAEMPYEGGSYGFLFDDEGWVIAHPKKSDIRGTDRDGKPLPPFSKENRYAGEYPFNLLHAGFVHKNYPAAASAVRIGKSGVAEFTNVGGTKKMMAYAPIPFPYGEFQKHGIFGGVAVGAEAQQFHKAAKITSDAIRFEFKSYIVHSWMFVSVILLIAFYVSLRLARSVVKPIEILSQTTKKMSDGNLSVRAEIDSQDEIGQLANSFNSMAKNLSEQRAYLENSLDELEKSRQDIIWEQVFKTTVFENIHIGVVTIDNERNITFMNASAREIFGIIVDDDVTVEHLIENRPCMKIFLEEGMENHGAGEYINAERTDGKKTYRASLIPLSIGSYEGMILTIEDVTERINMRLQIERMERLASLGRLSAGLAHEIRNPLTGINLLLDDLHDSLIGSHEEQRLIQKALSEIERLDKLVNELLSFARVPSMDMRKQSIVPILDDIIDMTKRQHTEIQFVTEYGENLPLVAIDGDKIKQAMMNLIKNGAESMKNGGKLTVSVSSDAKYAHIKIRDTGEGIPEDRLPLIFEPFYTKKFGGTGLGLSITHNIITDHRGEITVKSVVGEGTEFAIKLPLN